MLATILTISSMLFIVSCATMLIFKPGDLPESVSILTPLVACGSGMVLVILGGAMVAGIV